MARKILKNGMKKEKIRYGMNTSEQRKNVMYTNFKTKEEK
jgi:hypothetical protein